jgi:glycosyltransferase involved in cell wall biosynthesis
MNATVIISCYNQEKYIEDCLISIMSQETDFICEIIVSDDCSTDSTRAILQRLSDSNPNRLRLALREKNVGPAQNYLLAHAMATGDIVFQIDGDDMMLPGKLQLQYDVFRVYPEVNIVLHRAVYFSDDLGYVSETVYPGEKSPQLIFFGLQQLARWGSIAVHSSYAYRRSSRKAKIDGEFMEWFFAMDSLLDGGRGAYLNKVLVMYRSNSGGVSYLSTTTGRKKAYLIYFDDLIGYFTRHPDLRKDLYSNFLVTFLAMLIRTGFAALPNVYFLLKHLQYFRLLRFFETVSVRKLVGPARRAK